MKLPWLPYVPSQCEKNSIIIVIIITIIFIICSSSIAIPTQRQFHLQMKAIEHIERKRIPKNISQMKANYITLSD